MRRQLFLGLALLLSLVGGAARLVHAQTVELPRARQGYWIGVGLVDLASDLVEQGTNRGFYNGSGFTLRIGELLTERLGLGLLIDLGSIKKGSDFPHSSSLSRTCIGERT